MMKIKYRLPILIFLTLGIGYISWAKLEIFKAKPTKAMAQKSTEAIPPKDYDQELLLKFQKLCQVIDPSATTYQMQAQLWVVDGADSTKQSEPIAYFAGKNGADFYCKVGKNEIINADGFCLNINHENKMVVIKNAQAIPKLDIIPNIKDLMKTLDGEKYEIKEGEEEGNAYIRLINEYHITCKEYKISYDKVNMKPKSFYLRLTNFEHPEDRQMDKVISLQQLQISPSFSMAQLAEIPKVTQVNGKLNLSGSLSDYQVIGF